MQSPFDDDDDDDKTAAVACDDDDVELVKFIKPPRGEFRPSKSLIDIVSPDIRMCKIEIIKTYN